MNPHLLLAFSFAGFMAPDEGTISVGGPPTISSTGAATQFCLPPRSAAKHVR